MKPISPLLTALFCVTIVVASIVIVFGAWRWDKGEDTSLVELGQYNDAVQYWSAFAEAKFADSGNFSFVLDASQNRPLYAVSPPPLVSGLEYTDYSSLQYSANIQAQLSVNVTSPSRAFITVFLNSTRLTRFSLPYYRTSVSKQNEKFQLLKKFFLS
jgi:hypothetical protein